MRGGEVELTDYVFTNWLGGRATAVVRMRVPRIWLGRRRPAEVAEFTVGGGPPATTKDVLKCLVCNVRLCVDCFHEFHGHM